VVVPAAAAAAAAACFGCVLKSRKGKTDKSDDCVLVPELTCIV
jgi:hypothetical protein